MTGDPLEGRIRAGLADAAAEVEPTGTLAGIRARITSGETDDADGITSRRYPANNVVKRRRNCKVCKAPLTQASKRPRIYCSARCRDADYRKRESAKNAAAVRLSETNDWYTPPEIIGKAVRVLGAVDLDPASCAEANQVIRAARYLTEADDGLAHDWHGRIWLNPPYGRIAGKFIEHLTAQREAGNVAAAITVVNAHSTDARWFWPLWDGLLCFTYQRLDFTAGGGRRQGSTHGSVLAYFGPDPDRFAAEFKDVGAIVRRCT